MRIDSLSEFDLIDRFSGPFLQNLGGERVGIGDDCSVIPWDEEFFQLTTTDLLVEDIHFLREKITPFELGRKAVSVNVSDVAAMGGWPLALYLSLGLPRETELSFVDGFFRGLKDACDDYGVLLLGGDTTGSPGPIVVNITVQGKVERERVKLRRMAKTRDVVCVAGYMGDASVGLGVLLGKWKTGRDDYFVGRHHCPRAFVEEGRFLSKFRGVHAMMDLSDSLSQSLRQVCRQSRVGAKVELTHLPCSSYLEDFFSKCGEGREDFLASSGEDYGLLLTLSPDDVVLVCGEYEERFGQPLYQIGEVKEGLEVVLTKAGKPLGDIFGYDHFGRTSR